jgi:hypothetical protein
MSPGELPGLAARPVPSPLADRPVPSPSAARPAPSPSAARPALRPSAARPAPSPLAAPPSNDRFGCVPNWSLWRRVPRAPGQVLACLAHRHIRPVGGGANVGDRREQRVLARSRRPATRRPQRAGPVRSRRGGLLRPAPRTGASCFAGRGTCARAGTARIGPLGAAGRRGWPRTSPARRRRRRGTLRRGRCHPAGAGAQVRSAARRCQGRGRARRAGSGGRRRRRRARGAF